MDLRGRRTNPDSALGSRDTNIIRAAQFQHAVEDMDRHIDFGHPTFVYT
jgi:hypothetical protein